MTANALTQNQRVMSQAMERLSSGVRISSAADDAAGLAISSRLTSQIRGLDQAARNANDATSMIQTADGAMVEVEGMLQRMRELTVSAATGTNTTAELAILNTEFEALEAQIHSVSTDTQWNGRNILDGSLGQVSFQVGANASQTISITFADLNTDFGATEASQAGIDGSTSADLDIFTNLNVTTAGTTSGDETIDLAAQVITGSAQSTTLGYIDTAIARVSSHRATLGATINRLEYAADNLTNISQNSRTARSRILDTDYAEETTKLARTQIIQQAATAVLAQANQQAKSVLSLLQ
ncbi:flagellin [Porticoccaceae bacterium]|nr:flagellin [Porticoccaceae bacterium]